MSFLRPNARRYGPHECSVWQRPSELDCQHARWRVQQPVQQLLERFGHQPAFLPVFPDLLTTRTPQLAWKDLRPRQALWELPILRLWRTPTSL